MCSRSTSAIEKLAPSEGSARPSAVRYLERVEAMKRATSAGTRAVHPFGEGRAGAGSPIKDFRGAWAKACSEAAVPDKLLHDFRRTAVRNLERAGVACSAAMKMVGHRTEAIYRRYAITDDAMLKEEALKLAKLHAAEAAFNKVVAKSRDILPEK